MEGALHEGVGMTAPQAGAPPPILGLFPALQKDQLQSAPHRQGLTTVPC